MKVRSRSLPTGWYPDSAVECKREIDDFLRGFTPPEGSWIGGVVPHAGWYFSGKLAARVISVLSEARSPDRVVIYGGHLGGNSNPIVYTEDVWETPMGTQAMDSEIARELIAKGHALEPGLGFSDNTVEVQLPIIKRFFDGVPLIATHSPSSEKAVQFAAAVDELLKSRGLAAVFLGSSDLTHYGPNYGFTPHGTGASAVKWVKDENDHSLIRKAIAMDAQALLEDARAKRNTCSAGSIASVIESAVRNGAKAGRLLEYYTSYDIMPGSSFVGYAGIIF
ncbi:MAG: AmmeMemoRadiSam system protein B [Desulfomonilaceae bacterium]